MNKAIIYHEVIPLKVYFFDGIVAVKTLKSNQYLQDTRKLLNLSFESLKNQMKYITTG